MLRVKRSALPQPKVTAVTLCRAYASVALEQSNNNEQRKSTLRRYCRAFSTHPIVDKVLHLANPLLQPSDSLPCRFERPLRLLDSIRCKRC